MRSRLKATLAHSKATKGAAKQTHRYKIGDIVWVVKPGHSYNQYSDKFKEMGFTPMPDGRMSFSMYTRAEIWGVSMHQDGETPLYAIRDFSGNESLVGEKAITLVTSVLSTALDSQYPDHYVEFDTLRPNKAHIKWHPDTKMVTLPGLRMGSNMRNKLVESPNPGKVQIVRLYNPYTENYADYTQTGWNPQYSHFTDSVYNTHLRFDAMDN